MSGQHAGPSRERTFSFRVWPRPALHAAPEAPLPSFEGAADETQMLPRRTADREAVAAGLRARRDLTRQRDIETTVFPALRDVPEQSEAIPRVPLTEPPVEFDAMIKNGDERIARTCGHCGTLDRRDGSAWAYDAYLKWSCPACQMRPEWCSPSLPALLTVETGPYPSRMTVGDAEMRLMGRARLATWPNSVRQRPDGTWAVTIPVGGARRYIGSLGRREDAEAVYGGILNAFAEAATSPASETWEARLQAETEAEAAA